MTSDTVTILLVDDDEVDVRAIRRAFAKEHIENPVLLARNGREALDILRGEHGHERAPWPLLVLLDLNMPTMGGIEFLEQLRADPELQQAVVFVLTTSNDDRDKVSAYSRCVAGYLVKSRAGEDFAEQARMLKTYMRSVEFPPRGAKGSWSGGPGGCA